MARVRVSMEFDESGFQAVLAQAAGLVEEQAGAVAEAAGQGVKAKAMELTKFRAGERPGAVVTVAGRSAAEVTAANERLDRALPG